MVAFAFAGLLALAAGLLHVWAPFNAFGAGALAAAYLTLLYARGEVVGADAPAVAAGLLLVTELAWFSLEQAAAPANQPVLLGRRLALIGGSAVAAAGVGYVLLLVAAAPLPAGVLYTAAGALAALAAVAVLVRLLRAQRSGAS